MAFSHLGVHALQLGVLKAEARGVAALLGVEHDEAPAKGDLRDPDLRAEYSAAATAEQDGLRRAW